MNNWLQRTELLYGAEAVAMLLYCRVAVFGLGGVGGYVVEALARSGVGALDLIDSDTVNETNINRQIIALRSTVGQKKTEAAKARWPDIEVFDLSMDKTNLPDLIRGCDLAVDALDNLQTRKALKAACQQKGLPILSRSLHHESNRARPSLPWARRRGLPSNAHSRPNVRSRRKMMMICLAGGERN